MFNKKKEKAFLDALANQEYTIMVVEHVLEQMKDVCVTPEHYDDLIGNVTKLYNDIHEAELASILHFKEGYSVKEIADRFSLSETRIREYFKQNQETEEDNI